VPPMSTPSLIEEDVTPEPELLFRFFIMARRAGRQT
jgi:hypothetical protein